MANSGSIKHEYKSWFYATLYWWDESTDTDISNKTTTLRYKFVFTRNKYNVGDRSCTIKFGSYNDTFTVKGNTLDNSTSNTEPVTLREKTVTLPNTVTNGVGVCTFNYSFSLAVDATLSGTKVSKLAASGTGTAEPQYYNPNGRVINDFRTFRVDSTSSSSESNAGEVVYAEISLSGGVQANCSVHIYYKKTDKPTTSSYDGKVTLTPDQLTLALSANGLSGTSVFSGRTFSKEYAYHFLLEFAEAIPGGTGYYEPETKQASIPKSSMVMHLAGNPSGGVAFGQFSTSTKETPKFECNYPATFYKGVNIEGDLGDVLRSTIVDLIYPIGSLYISTNSADPSTFLGGSWSQIQDKFLLAAGATYTGGSQSATGVSKTVTVNIPNHQHLTPLITGDGAVGIWTNGDKVSKTNTSRVGVTYTSFTNSKTYTSYYTQKDGACSTDISVPPTIPPYLAVYVWKRTA